MTEITLGVVVVLLVVISVYIGPKSKKSGYICPPPPPPIPMPPVIKLSINSLVTINDIVFVKVDDKIWKGTVIAINSNKAVVSYGMERDKKIGLFDNTEIYITKE